MDPAQRLRERERQLISEYRPSHPFEAFDAEDLQCEDTATVEHWVGVYTELVDFVRSLVNPLSPDRAAEASGEASRGLRAIELQGRVLELHLAYWTDRLNRLRKDTAPG